MSFLSPAFLLALPLVAVPVIIHFFNRRRRQVIRWGAMDFLMASKTPRRRFLRWKELLLMLLRVAVILAMVSALAQPLMPSNWIGATGPREVVLVLDNSMSTARAVGNETVFEREIAEVARFFQQLNAHDLVRVMLASPSPEWLTDGAVSGDSGSLRALVARLRQIKPNDGAADFFDCVQEAMKIEPAAKDMARYVTVVTDGQAHGWRANVPGAWAALLALANRATPPVTTSVVIANGVNGPTANLALEKIVASRAVAGVGQPVTFTVTVKNTGTTPIEGASLAWSAGQQSLGVSAVPALQPGAGTTVSMSQHFANAGLMEVAAQLTVGDQLPRDNSIHFLLDVAKSVPILLVEGEPRTDPAQSDTQYFLAALGYANGGKGAAPAASIFQPKLIGYQNLAKEDFSSYQCVVLANVPRVTADVAQKLAHYVGAGGGLWIALGDQTDVYAFNKQLAEQMPGLSPLALKQPVGDAEDREKFQALVPPAAEHPATALLADTQRLDMDRARVYRRHQFDYDNRSSAVSVLLRTEGGAPVAIEKNLGRGRVVVQAIPLGLAWDNLPLCHSYVVLVHEWLWYLTEPGLVKRNLQAGELLSASQAIDVSTGSASLEFPTGRIAQLVGHDEGGRLVFRYPRTQFPGEYRLTMPGASPGPRVERFRINRDPEESDLTPLSDAQIKAIGEAGDLHFSAEPFTQTRTTQVAAPPRAMAQWLLAALVVLLVAEVLMAIWLARQRRRGSAAIVMEHAT